MRVRNPVVCRCSLVLAMATLMAGHSLQASTLQFFDDFNFRDVRSGDTTPRDDLVLGIGVVDTTTSARPEGAIVTATNLNTGDSFTLSPTGSSDYFLRVPHTNGLAAGDFVVQVSSDAGDGSFQIGAFGTGPGTGAMPAVQSLEATRSSNGRGLRWSLPSTIQNQTGNDGNVARLRVRLDGPDGSRLLDERGLGIGNTASLNAKDYTFDSGLFTENGLYTAQLLTEGFTPFNRSSVFESFLVDDIAGLGGTPVQFTDTYLARSRRDQNSVGWTTGDRLEISGEVDEPDGTKVVAQFNGQNVALIQADEPDRRFEFTRSIAFDPNLQGPWTLTAINGSETATASTHQLNTQAPIEFVRNIRMETNFETPTLFWDLPATGPAFDTVQIGVFDDETDFRLSVMGANQDQVLESLAPDQTSYAFRPGQLELGKSYVARVVLTDLDDATGETLNRSIKFFNFMTLNESDDVQFFLPTVDEEGDFNFDIDVTADEVIRLDPFVATGYDFATNTGDPLFATISLPDVGDGVFDLFLFDSSGSVFDSGIDLFTGIAFDLRTLGIIGGVDYAAGAARFRVQGIETSANLDPNDVTAFMADVSFASSGRFTGSMTALTTFVPDASVPAPGLAGLMGIGLLMLTISARRGKSRTYR
ncbi:MAG: hypothetical protein AAF458_07990 [Pseudomonadota bacterium]